MRQTSNGECTACKKEKYIPKPRKPSEPLEVRLEKYRERHRKYKDENREFVRAVALDWKRRNKDRCREMARNWKKLNPGKISAINRMRKLRRVNATPSWANQEAIKAIYIEAAKLGMHVDHIIPLNGELVCGLHVENNLQLLTPLENAAKGNRFDV